MPFRKLEREREREREYKNSRTNQLLQLCTSAQSVLGLDKSNYSAAHSHTADALTRLPMSYEVCRLTVINEKQSFREYPVNNMTRSRKMRLNYRAQTKIGLSPSTDRPCNRLEHGLSVKVIEVTVRNIYVQVTVSPTV